jgi:hypothetical protein
LNAVDDSFIDMAGTSFAGLACAAASAGANASIKKETAIVCMG